MKGFVILQENQAEDLTRFLKHTNGCEFTAISAIRSELISLMGKENCFNLKKSKQILHREITLEEIAQTLSHIKCWRMIVENENIANTDFAIIAEANITFSPHYYQSLLHHIDEYIQHSPYDLVLLERSAYDVFWNEQIFSGEGNVQSIIFNNISLYNNAHCQCYMIRKSFVIKLLERLEESKPYWLAYHFGQFCQFEQLSQVSPLIAVPKAIITPKPISVKTIDETLDFILENSCSVIRFGDGEFHIMRGGSITYQAYNEFLSQQLMQIVQSESSTKCLICVPDIFRDLSVYNEFARTFWRNELTLFRADYESLFSAKEYGNTFISRPYIDWQDKLPSTRWFSKLKQLWQNKDILIVEGETSRSGVGNDLFAEAKSIQRIICPSKNAYNKVEEIQQTIIQYAGKRLILLMLGPTAKVLAWNLSELGYRAIDIGHIDSEYEWFRMGSTEKVKLNHKHTAEFNEDNDIVFEDDMEYVQQIICRIESD